MSWEGEQEGRGGGTEGWERTSGDKNGRGKASGCVVPGHNSDRPSLFYNPSLKLISRFNHWRDDVFSRLRSAYGRGETGLSAAVKRGLWLAGVVSTGGMRGPVQWRVRRIGERVEALMGNRKLPFCPPRDFLGGLVLHSAAVPKC
jgi:hypothetical protein